MDAILKKFINVATFDIIEKKQYSPDMELTLFTMLDATFVLIKTDFFDQRHEESVIINIFNATNISWVQPKQKTIITIEADAKKGCIDIIDPTIKEAGFLYALAIITVM